MVDLRQYFAELNKDQRDLRRSIINVIWHMRGMTRDEAWHLTPVERDDIERMVKDRMDIVQKTGLPLM